MRDPGSDPDTRTCRTDAPYRDAGANCQPVLTSGRCGRTNTSVAAPLSVRVLPSGRDPCRRSCRESPSGRSLDFGRRKDETRQPAAARSKPRDPSRFDLSVPNEPSGSIVINSGGSALVSAGSRRRTTPATPPRARRTNPFSRRLRSRATPTICRAIRRRGRRIRRDLHPASRFLVEHVEDGQLLGPLLRRATRRTRARTRRRRVAVEHHVEVGDACNRSSLALSGAARRSPRSCIRRYRGSHGRTPA